MGEIVDFECIIDGRNIPQGSDHEMAIRHNRHDLTLDLRSAWFVCHCGIASLSDVMKK